MPDRILRDELLRSERYWAVSIEAQRLFVHLILVVDDTGRYSGANYSLRSACYPGMAVDPGKLEKLLTELVDVDLLRIYQDGGKRYVFIPRSRQRLRYPHSKYPAPPKEINDIISMDAEKTVSRPSQDSPKTVLRPSQDGGSEVKRSEVKRSEVKRSEVTPSRTTTHPKNSTPPKVVNPPLPPWLPEKAWSDYLAHRRAKRAKVTPRAVELIFATLERLKAEGHNPVAVLEQSIAQGWTGVFPVSTKTRAAISNAQVAAAWANKQPQPNEPENEKEIDGERL